MVDVSFDLFQQRVVNLFVGAPELILHADGDMCVGVSPIGVAN